MSQTYSPELKEQVVQEVSGTHNATLVARRHQLPPGMVRRWAREARQRREDHAEGLTPAQEIAQLKRLVIERDLQIMVLQDALRKKGLRP